MDTEHTCIYCDKPLNRSRVKALQFLNTPENQWAHVKCTPDRKVKGLFLGENGTSELQLCKHIYNDSVTKIFNEPQPDEEDPEEKIKD